MTRGANAALARDAFAWACALDVEVAKPGNVSVAMPGHDMDAAMFVASAQAAAVPLLAPGASVGARIEAAIEATRGVVACNTNLGIVLLCAPLAAALERVPASPTLETLRRATASVLSSLTIDDARAVYRAIARAQPGGLGEAPEQDVAAVPSVDLRAAMILAADRDRVARQYAMGYVDVLDVGLPVFRKLAAAGAREDVERAVLGAYLVLLGEWPDSHIVRKHGLALAQTVTHDARRWRSLALAGALRDHARQLAAWDATLKRHRINPGTTADLTVATAFVGACLDPRLLARTESTIVQRRV